MSGSQTKTPAVHVLRRAKDGKGNNYVVDCIVNNSAKTVAIRILSTDGKVDQEELHSYLPAMDYDSIQISTECRRVRGDDFELDSANLIIESFDFKGLRYLRLYKRLSKPRTSKTVEGKYITSWDCVKCPVTLRGEVLIDEYPITVESIPCDTAELSIRAAQARYDDLFTSTGLLYETSTEEKKAMAKLTF